MTAPYRWGILRDSPDWSVDVQPTPDAGPIHPNYPLASAGGVAALSNVLMASEVWNALTKPQRELLLSTVAECPIKARGDVTRRLIERGLLVADPIFPEDGNPAAATDAGRFVVQWRCR